MFLLLYHIKKYLVIFRDLLKNLQIFKRRCILRIYSNLENQENT